jgi:RNA 2',3'-cyclic 3'-phosphodiesterase
MRLFVGIPLADAAALELEHLVARLRPSAPQLRFTTRESWHITLQFLGSVGVDQLECVTARLSQLRAAPFSVQIGKLGFFDRAGVLFADVPVSSALLGLQESVAAATAHCGFAAEPRPYHPHITLARAKSRVRKSDFSSIQSKLSGSASYSPFIAQELLLFESHLSSQGSRYEVRARFPLGPGAGYTGQDESDR